jgi:hypothetical protein
MRQPRSIGKFEFDMNQFMVFTSYPWPGMPIVDENAHRGVVINLATSISLLDFELRRACGTEDPFGMLLGSGKRR